MSNLKEHKNYSIFAFVRDLAGLIKPYRWKFLLGFFLRLSSDIANLYPAWALSQIVTMLASPMGLGSVNDKSRLMGILLGWLGAVVYYAIAHTLAKWFGYQVSERVALDVRLKALQHIFTLDIAWQEKENTGNKLKRIDHGSRSLDRVIRIFYDIIVEATLNSVGMLVIFGAVGAELGGSLLIFMVVYFALSSYLTRKGSAQSYRVNELEEELEGLSFESLNNIKTVKALSIQQALLAKLSSFTEETFAAIRQRINIFRFRSGVLSLLYLTFEVGMVSYIAWQIVEGKYTAALLVLFVGYITKVQEAVSELAEITHEIVVAKIQFHRLQEILSTQPTIEGRSHHQQLAMPKNWQKIELKNITFSYEDKQVLKNFSLTIERGQKIGIVGLSGAGKSTLFSLLLDFYENYQGDILIDGVSLKKIDRQSYINHLAVVMQETELFNDSLKNNILVGGQPQRSGSVSQLNEVVKTAYLDEVIARLPLGLDTMIGEKGVKLSGGEKQRLGIARALYRQPDLLLMDEATSHLDVESEKKIQASLSTFFHQVTAVVIAHRLSTIREMDLIVVMQGGKIVESGSFQQLLKQKATFARLWEKQKL